MDFASKFVLNNEEEEYEFLSDDEFHGGMELSCSESDSEGEERNRDVILPQQRSQSKHHWRTGKFAQIKDEKSAKRWFRKADTNVVSVSFDTLVSASNTHAGDPVACVQCQAIMSHISKPVAKDGVLTWCCEFCGHSMTVDTEPEEIPTTEEVTFLLEPSATATSTDEIGRDESLVVFCVDTSGSMCVTSEVEGKIKLRGRRGSLLQQMRMDSFDADSESQYLPSQRRDVTYVSRLEAMQTAVEHQLLDMAMRFPHRRVALVAFNNSVRIIGDGLQEEVTVAGDKLTDMDRLVTIGSQVVPPQSVSQSHGRLTKKLNEVREGGATALGPALVLAINMAASCSGSKVIVCTDGKANIGLGNLEEDDEEIGREFYTNVGDMAVSKGVSVSVTTIQGTDCKLVHLGHLADKTGGQVNIVDPLNLVKEFGNILNEDFIATKVKAKFLVHKALYVVDDKDPESRLCFAEFSPGNVQRNTVFTFAFARRFAKTKETKEEKENEKSTPQEGEPSDTTVTAEASSKSTNHREDSTTCQSDAQGASGQSNGLPDVNTLPEFPFQVQMEYTDRQGAKGLRVITRALPATDKRDVAESAANLDILGTHTAKQSAVLALQGEYTQSRATALMNQRLAWRSSHSTSASASQRTKYRSVFGRLKTIENQLQQKQHTEIITHGRTYSDSSGSSDEEGQDVYCERSLPANTKARSKRMSKKAAGRATEMGDAFASMAFNLRRVTTTDFDENGACSADPREPCSNADLGYIDGACNKPSGESHPDLGFDIYDFEAVKKAFRVSSESDEGQSDSSGQAVGEEESSLHKQEEKGNIE